MPSFKGLVAALVAVIPLTSALRAQTPTGAPSVALPNTPAGEAVREWMDAFNSGDTARMRAHYVRYAISGFPETVLRRREATGGYDLVSIERSEPRLIEFVLKERKTGALALGVRELRPAGMQGVGGVGSARQAWLQPIPTGLTVKVFRIDAATRTRVIDAAIAKLDTFYVLADVAKHFGDTVRARQRRGVYDSVTNGASLAAILTDDLREVHRDAHLRVLFRPQGTDAPVQAKSEAEARTELLNTNCAFERAEVQAGNVGYVKVNGFASPRLCTAIASTSMHTVAGADALVIDLRDNGGGDPALEALVLSYLFDKRTHLYDVWSRKPEKTDRHWTRDKVAGKRFGAHKPVYVLISTRTFSGGESFAYTLQQQKRATIIGEQTGGGAHGVMAVTLHDRFLLFLPYARKVDAVGKSNWELTGVVPDVRVPAALALDTARALIAQRLRR